MDRMALIESVTDQDQRSFIKLGRLIGWGPKEIHDLLVRGVEGKAMSRSAVKKWSAEISKGRTDIEDIRGGPHRTTPNKDDRIERVKAELRETRSWSVEVLSLTVDIPKTSLWRILTQDLGLQKLFGQLVPHILSEDQKIARIEICHNNLIRLRAHPRLLSKTLAIDETWVKLYTKPRRDQMKHWLAAGEPAPRSVADELRTPKRMLILAMDFNGIAFWHLCDEKQTVTAEVYRGFLETYIPQWMANKRFRAPIILHDGATCHRARIVKELFEEKGWDTWNHPLIAQTSNPVTSTVLVN